MKITNDFKYKPANSIEHLTWLVSTQITAYAAPVPTGQISVEDRDWIALKIGAAWSAKVERGEQSCAWHEIAAYFGSVCQCSKCKRLSTSSVS